MKDILDNCKVAYHHALTEERKVDAAIDLLNRGKIVGNRSLLASP